MSTALVLLLVAGQAPLSRGLRWTLGVVLTIWAVVAGTGLIAAHYHYATDVIGALGVCAATVLGVALALDRWLPRPASSPDARSRPRISRGA